MKKKKTALILVLIVAMAAVLVWLVYRYVERERLYPLAFEEQISRYAKEFDVDPYWVIAIMHTESHLSTDAVSSSGAIGLMQVMPETGRWVAGKLGDAEFDEQKLFAAETNIRYGCWYFSFLLQRFDGHMVTVLAAYNAGQGSVGKWLTDPDNSSDGKSLSSIPSAVTSHYVDKVQKAYEKYKAMYPNVF